jgi:hypothetical protein
MIKVKREEVEAQNGGTELTHQNGENGSGLNPETGPKQELEARKTRAMLKEEHKAFVKAQKLKRRYYATEADYIISKQQLQQPYSS